MDYIVERRGQGATVRIIATELHITRNIVSDAASTLGPLRPGPRTREELARQSSPPGPAPDRPRPVRMSWRDQTPPKLAAAAWGLYVGPCNHPIFPDCRGHAVAEIASSLGLRYEVVLGVIRQQAADRGVAFPVRPSRRRPLDHLLPARKTKPRTRGGA